MSAWGTWTPGCGDVVSVLTAGSWRRPALVLSPAAYSARTQRAVVCPIAEVATGYPFEVEVPRGLRLPVQGVILADRVTSLGLRESGMRLICSLPDEVVTAMRERLGTLVGPP
jgi:mRNA interferase MazF